jgi:hypothetical protein
MVLQGPGSGPLSCWRTRVQSKPDPARNINKHDKIYHRRIVDNGESGPYNCGVSAILSGRTTPVPALPDAGLAQRAYLIMLERILRGDFAIGQLISRRKIAADLGISFLPASEALLRLECDGLLESRPRAGTRIRIPTREDVRGYFMVREALEVQAAIIFAGSSTL